jgi:hypothetical protein
MLLEFEPQQQRWDLLAGCERYLQQPGREMKTFLEACMRLIERLWVYSASRWTSTARDVVGGSHGKGEIVDEKLFPQLHLQYYFRNGRCSRERRTVELKTETGMKG